MFDLDKSVDEWSREFVGPGCGLTDRVEELKDHIYCEIEKNMEEGLPAESAFWAATRRFGISEELRAEFRSGRSMWSILRELDCHEPELRYSNRKILTFTLSYLVAFAALTFSLAYFLRGTDTFEYLTPVLYVLSLVPVVFAVGTRKQAAAECRFFKRMLKKLG